MTTTYEIYTNDGGTPKAVTGNAPAIVERVENLETSVETLEETLDNGVVTSVNGNTGNITPEQTGCLPLSGGTMTNAIYGSGGMIRGKTDDGDIWICGGTASSSSSYIQINGGAKANSPGIIEAVAKAGDALASLRMKPDGSLTLNGNNVITSAGGTMTGGLNMGNQQITNVDSVEFVTTSGANHGGYIDFHFNGSTSDFTSRIIEGSSGALQINATNGVTVNSKNIVRSVNGTTADASGNVTLELGGTVTEKLSTSGASKGIVTITISGLTAYKPVFVVLKCNDSSISIERWFSSGVALTGQNSDSIGAGTATYVAAKQAEWFAVIPTGTSIVMSLDNPNGASYSLKAYQ